MELGAGIIFNRDHFFALHGDPDGKHFKCWTMLGAWAESTSRAEIGALMSKARLAKLNPPPTRKIPVLIGGGGEK